MSFQTIANAAGWDGATQIEKLLEFIDNNGSMEELEDALISETDAAIRCASCGIVVGKEYSIDCTECISDFCDNCYDTGKGDGCHCHPEVNR